jgi:hypothetical protein
MKRWKYTLVAGKNLREAIYYDSKSVKYENWER